MACSQCDAPAVTYLRYSGRHLCKQHFLRFFERRAKAQLAEQGRLPEGRLAVALSGGKDSVSVLHFLHRITADHPRIELVAISVDEGIAGYREGALDICREMTTRLGVPWHVVKTKDLAGYDIDAYARGESGPEPGAPGEPDGPPGTDRPACGPCGVFRRVGINRLARELGASAVVTGHNLDDMAQTVLMNVLNGDVERMGRLAPHDRPPTARDGGPDAPDPAMPGAGLVPRLVPFRTIPEKEVLLYALLSGLPIHDDEECPYAERAHRFAMRDVLLGLEARSPGTRHGVLRFHDKLRPLLRERDAAPMQACPDCGEPTSGASCKACAWQAPGHAVAR